MVSDQTAAMPCCSVYAAIGGCRGGCAARGVVGGAVCGNNVRCLAIAAFAETIRPVGRVVTRREEFLWNLARVPVPYGVQVNTRVRRYVLLCG